MGFIRVGTSSWADKALTTSGWYPRELNNTAGRLAYYSRHFDVVEVDTTHYAIPDPAVTAAWAARTPAGFAFDVKAFSLFTGHQTRVSSLPVPTRPTGVDRVTRRDLGEERYEEVWKIFHASLEPLATAGKLGVVLLQFPTWLEYSPAALRRVLHEVDRCAPHRASVELSHGSWFAGEQAASTLAALRDHNASFTCVDMPQGLPSSVPPLLAVTAQPAVLRLHGRSEEHPAYSDQELWDWSQRLHVLSSDADEVHVLFDNGDGALAQIDAARFALLCYSLAS
jgi:uncharacterized protein YecE (DUF72 family)